MGYKNNAKTILGIDPGRRGYLCAVEKGDVRGFIEMPWKGNRMDLSAFCHAVEGVGLVVLEQAQAMPRQHVKSTFSTAFHFGQIEAALTLMDVSYSLVHPATWTSYFKRTLDIKKEKNETTKECTMRLAEMIYPNGQLSEFTDGMVDSMLIALWGYLNLQRRI